MTAAIPFVAEARGFEYASLLCSTKKARVLSTRAFVLTRGFSTAYIEYCGKGSSGANQVAEWRQGWQKGFERLTRIEGTEEPIQLRRAIVELLSDERRSGRKPTNGRNWNPVNLPCFRASTLSGSALALYSNRADAALVSTEQYNHAGERELIFDPNNQAPRFGYDDAVLFAYNRQGQRKAYTDQRGCSHEYLFDGLGRQIHDCVTAVGTGVDAAVRRLSTEYDVRGLVSTMSSFDNCRSCLPGRTSRPRCDLACT